MYMKLKKKIRMDNKFFIKNLSFKQNILQTAIPKVEII